MDCEHNRTKLKSFCTAKEHCEQNKKTSNQMGEDICKQQLQQRVNIKNVYRTHTTQQQEQSNLKNEQRTSIDTSPKKTCKWPTVT